MIRSWLGMDEDFAWLYRKIDSLEGRITKRFNELEDGGLIIDGTAPKDNTLRELVYGLYQYLKVRPRRQFYQEPAEVQTMVTKRKFWVEKIKK